MQGLPSATFVSKFKAKACEFTGGNKLLRRLEQKPCGLPFILIFLEMHCGATIVSPNRESIKSYIARTKLLAGRLESVAERMSELANEAEAANREPEALKLLATHGERPFELPNEIHWYASLLRAVSGELRDSSLRTTPMDALNILIDCLRVTDADLVRANKKLRKQTGKAQAQSIPLVPETARNQYIKKRIRETNFQDLELLLDIGYAAYGVRKTMDRDATRHLVSRASDRRFKRINRSPMPPHPRELGQR